MPSTITSSPVNVKLFKAKRRLERNQPDQVNQAICLECSSEYTSKPGQRPEIAVVHGKDHRQTSGHVLELHCVIDVLVDTIPSRTDRSELDRR